MGVCSSLFEEDLARYAVDKDILGMYLPDYYVNDLFTDVDLQLVNESWDYLQVMNFSDYSYHGLKTPLEYFHDIFFMTLFRKLPSCREYFPDHPSRERMVSSYFKCLLTGMSNLDRFQKCLVGIAKSHFKRGISWEHFNVLGEVTFISLSCILGDYFPPETNVAWVRLYSLVLKTILPVIITLGTNKNASKNPVTVLPLSANNISVVSNSGKMDTNRDNGKYVLFTIPEDYQI